MTWAKKPPRPIKQFDGEITPRTPAPAIGLEEAMGRSPELFRVTTPLARIPTSPHANDTRGRKIRQSARGKTCQVRYTGICSHDPSKTIWSHARWGAQLGEGGRGMGTKAGDLSGAYACTACDGAFDGQMPAPGYTREGLDLDWMLGHLRSLGILQRDGLI